MPTPSRTCRASVVAVGLAAVAFADPAVASAAVPPHLTGVVVSPSGKPVPHVFVTDSADDGNAGRTDANGRFDFANVNGETHAISLCAHLDQDAPQGGAAGWYDSCAAVSPGVDATIRFRPGAAIGGIVIDVRSGRPVAGAQVDVLDNNDNFYYPTTTDDHGYYRYRNLRPVLTYQLPGDAQKVTAAAPNGYLGVRPAPAPVNLRPGQVRNDLGIQIAPAVRYTGTVRDGSGAPVKNARVAVQTYDEFQQPLTIFQSAYTAADGSWTITRPWSGSADVCAWQGATKAHRTGLAAACVVVTSSALTVHRALTLAAEGGAVSGSVTVAVAVGAPTPTAVVTAPVPLANGGSLPIPATGTGTGTYTVSGLPSGTYVVQAVAGPDDEHLATGYSTPVTVTAGTTSTFSTIALTNGTG